ncbi:MAG: Mor transcription activator family protein [Thiofilum sp.]|uniref:Mor transcription activator family protein n=1 Tax=Thiofilum sp. TaxID=2212733 RepID=UPI0025DF5CED|nr:Mor transcription activator family protein [Thiofilum sp.]MBK8454109.1 hypothetical protein [Thiofilum sp.]
MTICSQSHDLPQNLPKRVLELADLIGMDNTLALMRRWGGIVFDIPRNAEKASRLKQVMDGKAVQALCAMWGGDRFYVPTLYSIERYQRDKAICDLRHSHSVSQLARQFHLSNRAIEKIIKRHSISVEAEC